MDDSYDPPPAPLPPAPLPDAAALRPLLDLLTELEATSPPYGEWIDYPPDPANGAIRRFPEYHSSLVSRLTQALDEAGMLVPFDWPSWQGEAETYCREPERLRTADFITIRNLFTLHVRKERFCEGHLGAMCDDGHVQKLLQRLKELVEKANL